MDERREEAVGSPAKCRRYSTGRQSSAGPVKSQLKHKSGCMTSDAIQICISPALRGSRPAKCQCGTG
ncbi:hypothetical protein HAX54_004327 [Datura stramonium]|uniref:Uncharacterized protein n=1 Tax=Datura stramonium TaxID=4076 RepID=A0ABS8RI80_DATST|nr:hypothetical protein [Datura stramonium]